MGTSVIMIVLALFGVLGLGGAMVFGISALARRKKNNGVPKVLSEDERRAYLSRCDSVLATLKGVADQRPTDPLDQAVDGLFPLLIRWRDHLAGIPEIPMTAKALPEQWEGWRRLLVQALEAEKKGAQGAEDAIREVVTTFTSLQLDYQALLDESDRSQTNDLVVEARVLQRLAAMDDALNPHRQDARLRE